MFGVILAAGEGSRMRPLSDERVKPLLPILDVPMVAWAIARLAAAGVEHAWVNASRDGEVVEEAARQAGARFGLEVSLSHEPGRPLGTAGALRKIAASLDRTFLLTNADAVTDAALAPLVDAHRTSGGIATLLAVSSEDKGDLVVEGGWATGLIDQLDAPRRGHMYCGIGVFEPEVLEHLPEGAGGQLRTVLSGAIEDDRGLAVVDCTGYFHNVGTPESHLLVNLDALSGVLDHQRIPPRFTDVAEWDHTRFVGVGAAVDGVELRDSVVGGDARVESGTTLQRCVVWDGAAVTRGRYEDSVLTGKQVVRIGR